MHHLYRRLWACAWFFGLLALAITPVGAREIKIVFSQYTPPYAFENNTGIVVDIVRLALEAKGYSLQPVYVPIGRAFEIFAEKRVDGTAMIQESSGLSAYYSDSFMQYHNKVFALESRQFHIQQLADIKDKSILGFQYAHKYLGPEFGITVRENPHYKEIANQETQVLMLLMGRIDLAVMDESIFRFYRQKLISEGKAAHANTYTMFNIFPPTVYKMAFNDKKVRDDFNQGLVIIRRNGQYNAVYEKYIERYFAIKK